MKPTRIVSIIFFSLFFFLITTSNIVLAGPVVDPGGPGSSSGFTNPLGSVTKIELFLQNIINWLLGLVGLLALLALIWGGIMYVVSLGDDNRVQHAKKIIFWAIVGLIVIALSYTIIIELTEMLQIFTP
ncbi:MAG: hypothetical protein Q8P73_00790 [bacterium]|nr:hypothetical protein [bacterium]